MNKVNDVKQNMDVLSENMDGVAQTLDNEVKEAENEENKPVKHKGRPKGAKDKKPRAKKGRAPRADYRKGGYLKHMKDQQAEYLAVDGKGKLPNEFNVDPKLTSHILLTGLELLSMPKCVTEEDYIERFNYFYQYCIDNEIKPTMEGFYLAFNIVKNTYLGWVNGEYGPFKQSLAQKARTLNAFFLTTSTMEGKVNPVTYIFYSKNYFGMVDKVDVDMANSHTVTPEDQQAIINQLPDPNK